MGGYYRTCFRGVERGNGCNVDATSRMTIGHDALHEELATC
jgi:hypothetical protein